MVYKPRSPVPGGTDVLGAPPNVTKRGAYSVEDYDQARRDAKFHLIGHMGYVAKQLDIMEQSTRAIIEALKAKEIDEKQATTAVQQTILQGLAELKLEVLTEHLLDVGYAEMAVKAFTALKT